jgi:TctA family transporter
MFDAVLTGLYAVVAWPAIGYLFLGVFIGLFFGAVPGLSGLVGMAILLPFTFDMAPVSAFAFLLGMFAVTTTSDTVASVLLGIPGTAASQATILDGYPMAQKGEASRAFGAAFTVSAIGGVLGALILGLSIPIVKPLILSFAQPEFFMLGLLGLTMVGSLSGDSVSKGLLAALMGLLLSYVGYAINGAVPRYWLGATYLLDGIPLIPLVLGLFALPEVLELAVRNTSISRVDRASVEGHMARGIGDAFREWWLVLRSTVIGAYVGMLPGLGGSIVDWVAYGHVVQSSRDKSQFGKGDVRGVIAPETANNAMKGGALIPTVAFGIPGSASMAILLGALLIQGLQPGPQMLTIKLPITFSMMWTLAIANLVGALLLMVLANQVARVAFIRGHLIVPAVCLFVFMGSWLAGNQMGDWTILLVFGVIGYLMKQGGVPRPPLVLGFILGPIMENSLHITGSAYEGLDWLLRPTCLVILALIVLTVVFATRSAHRQKRLPEGVQLGETTRTDPTIALWVAIALLAVLVCAMVPAFSWPRDTGFIPLITIVPGIALAAFVIFLPIVARRRRGARGRRRCVPGAGRARPGGLFLRLAAGYRRRHLHRRTTRRAAAFHDPLPIGLGALQMVVRRRLRYRRLGVSLPHVRPHHRGHVAPVATVLLIMAGGVSSDHAVTLF